MKKTLAGPKDVKPYQTEETDGPESAPRCRKCGHRARWWPEIAKRNWHLLKKEGITRGSDEVRIKCEKCGHPNWRRLPGSSGLSRGGLIR